MSEKTNNKSTENLKKDVMEEDEDEGEVFRLYTPKLHNRFKEMREATRKRIKESENDQIVMHEKIVDGEIVYETESGDNNSDDLLFDDYDGRDPTLEEGNILPIRLGLVPRKIYQKPAIEIDQFIHNKYDVILFILTIINKF
jgi:hypothetical protein